MNNLSEKVDLEEFHQQYQEEFENEAKEVQATIQAIKDQLGKDVILIPLDQALRVNEN